MRIVPILMAVLVSALIYAFVFERSRLANMLPDNPQDAAEAAQIDESPQLADEPMRVVVQRSSAREVESTVTLRGQTEADRVVELRAETSGLVTSEPEPKGSLVERGEVLCRLDPAAREAALQEARARLSEAKARVPEAESRLQEARARREEAEINYSAAENLVGEGFTSQSRLAATRAALRSAEAAVQSAKSGVEAARAGIEGARASVASAEKEIERLRITAPFRGVLETDTAEIGSLLQPGGLCVTVLQLDPITLVGFVSELQVARVALGAPATARTASGRTVSGEVSFLSRSADQTTRTFRVEIRVPNPDLTLRDGETAEITVEAEGKAAHLLPQSALTLDDAGTLGLRLVEDDRRVTFVPVTLLRDTPNGVWLTGLPDAADVIVIGQDYVTEGVRVRPVYQELGQ
ncbi:efflux RND transporter periplasmic adaptor subunit [Roseovarius sp. D22-M7]|uniref:efflux RND transporter periplasmic adaptor subunit n=1 Tax=Roseovarius sp. D22-M7 TaxID=3127116 RepID=UPI0030104A1A